MRCVQVISGVTLQKYIYIYEMCSSYIWCNSTKVTHFLDHIFLRDLTIKKKNHSI